MTEGKMSVAEARRIVAETLATHGDEIDLKPLLKSIPPQYRALVQRMLTELRQKGEVTVKLTTDAETIVQNKFSEQEE